MYILQQCLMAKNVASVVMASQVIAAEPNRLTVITHHQTRTGEAKITINGVTAIGSRDFEVVP